MIIRDFYFAAGAIEQGYAYQVANGALQLLVDTTTLHKLQQDYNLLKPYFNRVRKLVREVSASRNNAN